MKRVSRFVTHVPAAHILLSSVCLEDCDDYHPNAVLAEKIHRVKGLRFFYPQNETHKINHLFRLSWSYERIGILDIDRIIYIYFKYLQSLYCIDICCNKSILFLSLSHSIFFSIVKLKLRVLQRHAIMKNITSMSDLLRSRKNVQLCFV